MNTQNADDLVAFADPFTKNKIRVMDKCTRVEFVRNGRDVAYEIDKTSGKVAAKHRDKSYASLDSLLSSDEFAGLEILARTVISASNQAQIKDAIPTRIEAGGLVFDAEDYWKQVSIENNRVNLVLLDGPAGVGKTFQIECQAYHRAQAVKASQRIPGILHVSSRGRRLSNLQDVLASTTQHFGARFGAKQVPVLVRRGLLIVAIDGFDELVDADGYADAWLALRRFIDDLGRQGTVVLAARDTFVEEQELLQRIERTSQDVHLQIAHMLPVSPADAKTWMAKASQWTSVALSSDVANDVLYENSYALRPFFLRELRKAKGWKDVAAEGPRTFLVSRLVTREAKLLAQQLGIKAESDIRAALVSMLQEAALEMGLRESDSVEVAHLSFLAQFCFEGILDEGGIRKLIHKAGSMALMELDGGDASKRRFPHSEIQYYFLGEALLKELNGRTIPPVLRRSVIGADQLEVFEEVFSNELTGSAVAMSYLTSALSADISNDGFGPNAAALLILGFGLRCVSRIDYASATEATLAGQSPIGTMTDCEIMRLDARHADLSGVIFNNCSIGTLVADEMTRFGSSRPLIKGIEVRRDSEPAILRREELDAFVNAQTSVFLADDEPASKRLKLLDRLARRSLRHFFMRATGDEDAGAQLLQDAHWPFVRAVLEKYGRVEVYESRQMHGRASPLIRIKNPRALLDIAAPETAMIVRDLRDAQ